MHAGELGPTRECVTGVGTTHPVGWRDVASPRGPVIVLQDIGGLQEKSTHHAPQTRAGDASAAILAKTGKDRRGGVPAFRVTGKRRSTQFALPNTVILT